MGLGKHYVTPHTLSRVKERWPGASSLGERALVEQIAMAIEAAEQAHTAVHAPGGLHVPFSLGGKEGYLLIKDGRVVTALSAEHCAEVRAFAEGK
jgi:hypothetical protein